jgi:hypothetical protein
MLSFMVINMRKHICSHLKVLRFHWVMFVTFERLFMGYNKPLMPGLRGSVLWFKLLAFILVSMTLHSSLIHLSVVVHCYYSM